MTSDGPIRSRVRRRLVAGGRVVLIVLVALGLVYEIGANWLLRSERGRSWLLGRARRTQIEWTGAWSWFPGRVHAERLTIAGVGRRQRWTIELEEVETRLDLLALFGRRLRFAGSEVSRARIRLAPGEDEPPPSSAARPGGGRWRLEVERARIERLERLEAGDLLLLAAGPAAVALGYRFGGELSLPHFELDLPGSRLYQGNGFVAEFERLAVTAEAGPFTARGAGFLALLEAARGTVDLRGQVESLGLLNNWTSQASWLLFSGGRGELDLLVALRDGVVEPESRLSVDGQELTVEVLDWVVSGTPTLEGDFRDVASPRLGFRFDDYSLRRAEDRDPYLVGDVLTLELVRLGASLLEPAEVEVELDLDRGRVRDVSVFNRYLGDNPSLRLRSGGAEISSHLELASSGPAGGESTVSLAGSGIEVDIGELTLRADLAVDSRLGALDPVQRRFALRRVSVSIANGRLRRGRETLAEEWGGQVDLSDGTLRLDRSLAASARVALEVSDVLPLLNFFDDGRPKVGTAARLLKIREVSGSALLDLGPEWLRLDRMDLQADHAQVEGRLCLGRVSRLGALYATLRGVNAATWFEREDRRWTVLRPRRWYEERLATVRCSP